MQVNAAVLTGEFTLILYYTKTTETINVLSLRIVMIALLPYLLLRIRKSKFSADSPRYNAFVKNVWNDFAI